MTGAAQERFERRPHLISSRMSLERGKLGERSRMPGALNHSILAALDDLE